MNCPDYTLAKDYPLKQEQNEMIDFAIKRPYAVISGQTGLGKTYTAVTLATQLMLHNKNLITIIIAPPKAVMGFEKELTEKLKVSYALLTSDNQTLSLQRVPRFIIVSDTCVGKVVPYMREIYKSGYKFLGIVDEAHNFQNASSKKYKEFLGIRRAFSILYFLTATSCKNNIEGLYYMISLLNPQIFFSWNYFKTKYLVMNVKTINQTTKDRRKIKRNIEEIVGYKNLEELQAKLNDIVIVRQVQYNLEFNYHRAELTNEETSKYLEASSGKMSDKAEDFWSVRLRDITFVVDNIYEGANPKLLSSKEKIFMRTLLNNIRSGKPTIVYCEYKEVLNRLKDLINAYKSQMGIKDILEIHGGISMAKRKKIQNLITVDKPLLITSAGGESINLQKANAIIFYDLPYDIAKIMQIIGRITRVDTKFSKQYIDIIEAFGTTDTYKRLCMEKNMKLIESLFGKMNTLPMSTYDNDQKFMSTLRRSLLWAFKRGRLITENELDGIFERFNN